MKKICDLIMAVTTLLLVFLELTIGLKVWHLNIIPNNYSLLIVIAVIVGDLLIVRLLLAFRGKNTILCQVQGNVLLIL